MAEMRVPAWPIPTQKTKFVMSNAQPTLLLRPQMPMPRLKRTATITPRFASAASARPKQIHHAFPGRASIGLATSSVTSPSEGCPTTQRTGARPCDSIATTFEARASDAADTTHLLEVGDIGARPELVEHLVSTRVARHARHPARRIA